MWKALASSRRLGVAVDPAEDQRGIAEVEVGEPVEQGLVEHVALEAGLERAAEAGLVRSRRRQADSRVRSRHS